MKENRIVFLPFPENLREFFKNYEQDDLFSINPDIPIPVELPEDEQVDPGQISEEMILCGMLRVIEGRQARQDWLDYYSSFIIYLRPEVLDVINEMKDSGLADEKYIEAHNFLKEGKAQEGLNTVRAFIERYPLLWNGWFLLGWALRLLNRWQDAQNAFNKAIELGGDNCDIRNELAICLMETGDIAGAKRELEAALYNDPENIKLISNLGVLALKTGDKEKAAAFFRTVLEIDKDDPIAKKYLEDL